MLGQAQEVAASRAARATIHPGGLAEKYVDGVLVKRLPPAPERPELHYNQHAFDSGLRVIKEARVADVDALPRGAASGQRIYDLPSSRLYSAQRRHKEWTMFADARHLGMLKERSRTALKAFYWEGRTAEEIAEQLNVKVTYRAGKVWNNHVWVILLRARQELLKVGGRFERR